MEDKKGQKLLINAINNFNLSTTYAQDILRKKRMTEYDFREKTINDLYNEKLTKDEKIKKINRRCNKEEISNHRRIDKIKRDKNTKKPRK